MTKIIASNIFSRADRLITSGTASLILEVIKPIVDDRSFLARTMEFLRRYRRLTILLAIVLLFFLYIDGLSKNPPGFYVDESGLGYNAYLLSRTGRGEFGPRFPLFFQFYTDHWTQWASPTQVYLLSIPFLFLEPSILKARVFSAAWVFAACLLLGFLARRISGQKKIGFIVSVFALLTPWLFEVSRLVLETFFYPMALVLFLLAVHYAQRKPYWSWRNVVALALTLMLLTYSYSVGRVLGPLMAIGLVVFATTKDRLPGLCKTWALYAVSLVPFLILKWQHPERLTKRFYETSYLRPGVPWSEISAKFIRRFLEDLSLINLLIDGDGNPRHHVSGALGSFLVATFILAVIGLVVAIVRHWSNPWWQYIFFGTLASIVPGAVTENQFHVLRLIAYPVFLLILTIPALQFLLERSTEAKNTLPASERRRAKPSSRRLSWRERRIILAVLLIATIAQVIYFQSVYRRKGPVRGYFDAEYKAVYDAATAQPKRPIYLVDGTQPAYVHAYWYAVMEGRDRAEFIHVEPGKRPPAGAVVLGAEEQCVNCEIILKNSPYILYRLY